MQSDGTALALALLVLLSGCGASSSRATAPGARVRLTVRVPQGAYWGSVTSTPPGISCGNRCRADFPRGTAVTLAWAPHTAQLAQFNVVEHGDEHPACAGHAARDGCTLTLDEDREVSLGPAVIAPPAPPEPAP